jgi:hypothetical protein
LPYQFFHARTGFSRALVSKFTILSIDFNDAGQRESFLADYAGKLVWGLPAAMTEFSLTLPSTVRDPRDRCRFVWMPAGAVCVVQGRFFTFSQGRTNYLLLLFRFAIFVYWTSNFKRNPKKRKDESAGTGELDLI